MGNSSNGATNGHHSILMKGVDLAEMMMDRGLLSPATA
jgi:hypothetical protein